MWAPKKCGLFFGGCELSKTGIIQCAKIQFQAQIYKFYSKIASKLNFSKCARNARKFVIRMQNLIQKWKEGVIGCGLNKKRGSLGVRLA